MPLRGRERTLGKGPLESSLKRAIRVGLQALNIATQWIKLFSEKNFGAVPKQGCQVPDCSIFYLGQYLLTWGCNILTSHEVFSQPRDCPRSSAQWQLHQCMGSPLHRDWPDRSQHDRVTQLLCDLLEKNSNVQESLGEALCTVIPSSQWSKVAMFDLLNDFAEHIF